MGPIKSEIELLLDRIREKDAIINGISDVLMVLDARTYTILEVNQAFLDSFKLSREQVLGKGCFQITHHLRAPCNRSDEHLNCPLAAAAATGKPASAEHTHLDSEGRTLYFEITTYPVKNEVGEVHRIIHLSRNITERKQAELEIKRQSEKIKMFAYSVCHDLKSPATAVYGLAKLLVDRYGDSLDEKGKKNCDLILKASEQIADLAEKINLYVATKEFPLRIEKVVLKEILRTIQDEFSSRLSSRDVRFCQPGHFPKINADRISVLRLFRNLVDNALKHGGDKLSRIEIDFDENESHHILIVRDNGKGFFRGRAKDIFKAFRREDDSGVEGMGLGLAIVKEIAELHGGDVRVETGENKTAFHVSISKNLVPS